MAAHWRFAHLPGCLAVGCMAKMGQDGDLPTCRSLRQAFHRWPLREPAIWCAARPHLVRLMCLAMVQDHTQSRRETQMDLYVALRPLYGFPADA